MTFEASIDRLTAALEAFTGILVTKNLAAATPPAVTTETLKTNGAAAPAAEPAKRGRGRPPAVKEPEVEEDVGFGDDDDLGGDEPPSVTPEEARTAVIAYRDAAVKALDGDKDAAMAQTRAIMKPIVSKIADIDDSNAAAVVAAFAAATKKLGKGK